MQAAERPEALCCMFAGLLPELNEAQILAAREQVVARFWGEPDIAEPVLNLIDGHLAWRILRAEVETTD